MPSRRFRTMPLLLRRWAAAARQWRTVAAGLVLVLLLAQGAWAQGAASVAPKLPFEFERAGTKHVRLPFEFQRNLIIVEVYLNGKGPFNFMLDSGVGLSLITDPSLIQTLKLRRGASYSVSGVGEEAPLEAFLSDSVRVNMPGVRAPALSFLVLSSDVLNLSGYVGAPVHGILGYDVFRCFVVEVRPDENMLRLTAPDTFKPPRGRRWNRIGLDLEGRKAYLNVPVAVSDSLTMPLKLVLDTGAGHALSLETNSDPQLRVPEKRLRAQLGLGLNGAINGYLGRVRSMQLGRYKVQSLLTSFPDASNGALRAEVPRNGNIGFELLKRFDIAIDYTHNALWIRPNALFKDPFEHDMCGMEMLASGADFRRYTILRIQAGSPAAEAGLRANDELLSVNLLPVGSMTLTQLSRLFHSADGRRLLLIVQRDGELVTATVHLKRQI